MDGAAVERVRSFNRLVTERVGALNDNYLARDRSLGEARVLWEIGPEGRDVRDLHHASGSTPLREPPLRSLEAAGLVVVAARRTTGASASRSSPAQAPPSEALDRRSDELAHSFLAPLSEARDRLVAAITEWSACSQPRSSGGRRRPGGTRGTVLPARVLRRARTALRHGLRSGASISAGLDELRLPRGAFLLATLRGDPVGSGALKFHGDEPPS
jgi:hypothetical protein